MTEKETDVFMSTHDLHRKLSRRTFLAVLGGGAAAVALDRWWANPYRSVSRTEVPEQMSSTEIIAKQLLLGLPITRFNGSILQEKTEGTHVWPDAVVVPRAIQPFAPLNMGSYEFFTIRHNNGLPTVKPVTVVPGMMLVPGEPNGPVVQEVFVTPFKTEDLLPNQDPAEAHNYVLSGFVEVGTHGQSPDQRGGVAFIGTEAFLQPKTNSHR